MMNFIRRSLGLILAAALICTGVTVRADDESEIRESKEQNEKDLSATQERLNTLAEKREKILGEISDLNADLVDLMLDISSAESDIKTTESKISETEGLIAETQTQIDAKQKEIDTTQVSLTAAEDSRDSQYEDMKKRIQYIYENGGDAGWAVQILETDDLTSFFNKVEYTESLSQTDRDMLDDLKATVAEVEALKTTLEGEKAELETSKATLETQKATLEEQKGTQEAQKAELEEQKAALDEKIAEKESTSSNYEEEIATAKQQAADLTAIIAEEAEQLRTLEAERQAAAAEAAAAAAKAAKASEPNAEDQTDPDDIGEIDYSATGEALGREIVAFADRYVGYPYVWGGCSLTEGCDCSHFVWLVLRHCGAYDGEYMTSGGFPYAGEKVNSLSEARAGDVICYPHHVAIYDGNGLIVEAKGAEWGITHDRTADHTTILAIRRFT